MGCGCFGIRGTYPGFLHIKKFRGGGDDLDHISNYIFGDDMVSESEFSRMSKIERGRSKVGGYLTSSLFFQFSSIYFTLGHIFSRRLVDHTKTDNR